MARPRGRPREVPATLVYLRLAVTPEEHRRIQLAAPLDGVSMAQFARRAVVDAATKRLQAGGLDPDNLPEPAGKAQGEEGRRDKRK